MTARLHLHLPNLGVGGTERWALSLMAGIPGVRWTVSMADVGSPISDDFASIQIAPVGELSGRSDVVISSWGLSEAVGQPVVAVAHATFPAYAEMMRGSPYSHAAAVSQAARAVFPAGAPVATIYNGIEVDRLAAVEPARLVRARLGIAEGATVVGYVGRWGFQKNPAAAASAAASVAGGVALFVGPLPNEEWLRLVTSISEVRFVAPDDARAIGDLYRAMDLCIVPSRTEGFSFVTPEAWFCRTPVLATDVGIVQEHPDLVTPLAHDADPVALKRSVEEALAQRGGVMLDHAHQKAATFYTADRMARDWRTFLSTTFPGLLDEPRQA